MDEQSDGLELVQLGSEIAEKGVQLKQLRAKRAELDKEIGALETALNPLVVQHAKIIAELVGTPVPTQSAAPPAPPPRSNGSAEKKKTALQERIRAVVEKADPGVGAREIAEALQVDPALVREAMLSMARK